MCDLRASVPPAVRGSGISLRFSYLVARRRSILPPLSSSSLPACFAVSPCRSHPRPLPHVLRSCPLRLFLSCVLVWFLIALLPVLATSRAGRYLLVCLIRFRFSLSRPVLPPPALPLSSRVPVLACPSWIVLDRSLRSPVLVSCRRLPVPIRLRSGLIAPCSSCLPVLRQAWAGSVSARSCLPIALVWGILIARAAGGVGWIASAGTGLLLGVSASGGGCVRFAVSLFVYIN